MGRFEGRFGEVGEGKSEKSVIESLEKESVGIADDCLDCVGWNSMEGKSGNETGGEGRRTRCRSANLSRSTTCRSVDCLADCELTRE